MACALTGNQTHNPLFYRMMLQSTEPHWPEPKAGVFIGKGEDTLRQRKMGMLQVGEMHLQGKDRLCQQKLKKEPLSAKTDFLKI